MGAGSYAAWVSSLEGARGLSLGRECVRAAGAALSRAAPAAALALRKLCADCAAPAAALAAHIAHAAQVTHSSSCTSFRWYVGGGCQISKALCLLPIYTYDL